MNTRNVIARFATNEDFVVYDVTKATYSDGSVNYCVEKVDTKDMFTLPLVMFSHLTKALQFVREQLSLDEEAEKTSLSSVINACQDDMNEFFDYLRTVCEDDEAE